MKKLIPLLILVLLVVGCATIVTTPKQDISLNSNPKGANVVVKTVGGIEVFSGTTPATCKLERKNEYIVYINVAGYKESQIIIGKEINMWVIGNLLCGGVPGLIIDGVTGSLWNLSPETIQVDLKVAYNLDGESELYACIHATDYDNQLRYKLVKLEK